MIKEYGPAAKYVCNNCHNEEYWNLIRRSVWFTLFFIPIFPYEWEYWLICPVCSHGATIGAGEFHEIKEYAMLNSKFVKGEITEEEYKRSLMELSGDTPKLPGPE